MNIYKRYEETIGTHRLTVYLTIFAGLIAMLWMVSAIAPAKADDYSLANEIEAHKAADEAAMIPKPEFTPDNVVRMQLDALANNDTPYQDAGIEIAFRFASPANKQSTGPLSRFIRLVHNPAYKPMLNHQTARFGDLVVEDAKAILPVYLTASDGTNVGYIFILSKQAGGTYDQCWMTDAVLRFEVKSA